MHWILILVIFDTLSDGAIWIDSATIPMANEQQCDEQLRILKSELRTANTIMCWRK